MLRVSTAIAENQTQAKWKCDTNHGFIRVILFFCQSGFGAYHCSQCQQQAHAGHVPSLGFGVAALELNPKPETIGFRAWRALLEEIEDKFMRLKGERAQWSVGICQDGKILDFRQKPLQCCLLRPCQPPCPYIDSKPIS